MPDESGEGGYPDEVSRVDGLKDRLKDAGQKVSAASKKAAQKTSELGSAIAESSVAKDIAAGAKKVGEDVKGASAKVTETVDKKRGEFKERREAAKVAKAEADDIRENEILSEVRGSDLFPITVSSEQDVNDDVIVLSREEYSTLLNQLDEMKSISHQQEITTPEKLSKSQTNDTLATELSRSMNDVLTTLGVSVVFAGILVATNFYFESNPQVVANISIELFIWPVGTGLWSFYILHRLARSRTFLKMPIGMRIQTAIGVGLATELALLLNSETVAITNIWGWTATVAFTAILLSGIVRGFMGSISRLFGLNKEDEDYIDIKPIE